MSASSMSGITLGATEILSSIDNLCLLSKSLAAAQRASDVFYSIYLDLQKFLSKFGTDLKFFGESHFDTLRELLPCVERLRANFETAFGKEQQMVKRALSRLRTGVTSRAPKNEKAFQMLYDRTIGKRFSTMGLFDIAIIRTNLSLTSALLARTIDILVGRRDAQRAQQAEDDLFSKDREQEKRTNEIVNFLEGSRARQSPRPLSIFGLPQMPGDEPQRQGSADSAVMKSLQRLRTPDYLARHKFQQSARSPGTCAWLLKKNDYLHWQDDGFPSVLSVCGPPGIGKSILVSQVCDHLYQKHSSESGFYFAYFYMGYDRIQSAVDVATSLVKQLCDQSRWVPLLLRPFLNSTETLPMPPLSTLMQVLSNLAGHFHDIDCRTFIVLDGWDEPNLTEDPGFSLLFKGLYNLGWRVLVTYRSHNRPRCLDAVETIHQRSLTIRPVDTVDDLRSYVNHEICSSSVRRLLPAATEEAFNSFLREKIDAIVEKSGNIFARAAILTKSLLEQPTLAAIDAMLETTPDDLSAEYARMLDTIQQQPEHLRVLANRTLIWLACAKRPISERGLCQALAVALPTSDDDGEDLLSAKRVPQIESVLSSTKGLVTFDLGTSSILLAYYGLKSAIEDYYSDGHRVTSSTGQTFASEQRLLAIACVRYLNLGDCRGGLSENATSFAKRLETAPFLSYACQFWTSHVSDCGPGLVNFNDESESKDDFSELFSNRRRLEMVVQTARVATTPLSWYDSNTFEDISREVRNMTDLDLMLAFISSDNNNYLNDPSVITPDTPNKMNYSKQTGLLRILIEYCLCPKVSQRSIFGSIAADPESRKKLVAIYFDRRPNPPSMSEAIQENRLGALVAWAERLKEERRMNTDPSSELALFTAIKDDKLEMVKTLLAYGINLPLSSEDGRLPLFIAVENNSLDMVELLLDHGADINTTDGSGRCVLHIAAAFADGHMVDRLLERGADINHCDDDGCTPLFEAISHSNNQVITNLIEAGVPLTAKRRSDAKTALDHAESKKNKRAIHQLRMQMLESWTTDDGASAIWTTDDADSIL